MGSGAAGRDRRRPHGRRGAMAGADGIARARSRLGASLARHDSDRKLEGCDGGERDQNRRGALMRRASQVWAIGHKARSTKLQAAVTKRPSSAGNIFTLCMISGPSARKTALDGKIPAPCIQNHSIAPGNGHMGRRCCHFYPKKHAWGENAASKGAYCAHSAKRERIRRDSCQIGPRSAAMQGRGARFYGAARWVTPLGRATRQVAAPTGWAGGRDGAKTRRWWVRGGHNAGGNDGAKTRRWRDRWRSQAGTSSPGRDGSG